MQDHSVYIHLPFCTAKCPYCDFGSITLSAPPFEAYQKALRFEWRQLKTVLSAPPVSIYIGGGTPSIWPEDLIVELLSEIPVEADAEITVEVNPGSLSASWLNALRDAGVNRISIGVQSLSDERLEQLGRRHTADDARDAVQMALSLGFRSVSADIIYGTSGHTESVLATELTRLAEMGVHHISAYELTLSRHSPMGRKASSGSRLTVNEEEMVHLWHATRNTLSRHGIEQYEVSSYSREKHTSRHNRHYWNGGGYIGLGASAHGFIRGDHRLFRYRNLPDPAAYISCKREIFRCFDDKPLGGMAEIEKLTRLDHARERAMLGLRTVYGFPFLEIIETLPEPERTKWHRAAAMIIERGLGTMKKDRLTPTLTGLLQADAIAEEFF